MSAEYSRSIEVESFLRIIESVQNGSEVPQKVRSVDWDQIYKLADYHRVANLVYLALIGMETSILDKTREKFFEKYQESFFLGEKYEKEVERLLLLFDRNQIHCMLFGGYLTRATYPIKEMQMLTALEFFIDKEQMAQAEDVLIRIGYEREKEEQRNAFYYTKERLHVVLKEFAVITGKKKIYKRHQLKKMPKVKGFAYIHQFDNNQLYVRLIQELVDYYVDGEIHIRRILDYWNYYKQKQESLDWGIIEEELKKIQLLEFEQYIKQLAQIWFDEQIAMEHQRVYSHMEQYILTKGAKGREISEQILPLILVEQKKEQQWEKKKKKKEQRQWKYPKREYMQELFPILYKYPLLLPIFWYYRLYYLRENQKKNDKKS